MRIVQGTPEGVEDNGSLTRVAAFPIGMDPEAFTKALTRPDVVSSIKQLLSRYAGRKVCLRCHEWQTAETLALHKTAADTSA